MVCQSAVDSFQEFIIRGASLSFQTWPGFQEIQAQWKISKVNTDFEGHS